MFLLYRLTTRNLPTHYSFYAKGLASLSRKIKLKPIPYKTPPEEDHDDHNMKMKRRLSPHLTIYNAELTSMTSIWHRMTGVAVSGYVILWGLAALVLPDQISDYIEMYEDLELPREVMFGVKMMFSLPLCFHYCNGIRHLIWDLGKFLSMRAVYATGYIMLTCMTASALVLTFLL